MIQTRPVSNPGAFALVFIVGMLTIVPVQAGHPFHSTSTEMEWNPESRRFEVSLQLPGLQIDEELSRIHKRRINMESTADAEQLLEKYIKSKLVVTGKGFNQSQLHWAGVEIDSRNVWAYFEVELLPNSAAAEPVSQVSIPDELNVECRYFLDSHESQGNLITIIHGTRRATAELSSAEPRCRVTGHHKLETISVLAVN